MSYSLFASTTETKDTIQVIAADFDGDGDADVVAFNTDGTSTYDHDVYLNASGTLSHNATMGDSNGFKKAAAGDIDGDGDIDFVAVTSNGNAIVKYVNDGSATFTSTTITSGLSAAPTQTLLADVDNDGDLDIVIGSTSAAVSQAVYLNDGSATFTAAASPLPAFTQIAATDFDSDGDLDLALLRSPIGSTENLFLYKNTGTGAFFQDTIASTCADACSHYGLDTADFDGDGDIDVLEIDADGGYGENRIYLNNGAGTFTYGGSTFGTNSSDVRAQSYGDVDNDGDFDGVTGGVNDSYPGGNETYLNNGSASFSINGSIVDSTLCGRGIVLFDSDGDGDLDYVSGNTGCPSTGGAANRHYTSDQAATSANAAPTAPSSFTAAIEKLRNSATSAITTGNTGKYSAIAKGSDNLPVIAYVDANQDLAVLHCGNATCTSGNTNTVVSAGTWTDVSIAIGSDGYPVMYYHESAGANPMLLHCGNVSCTSGNSENTLGDQGGDVALTRVGISNNLPYVGVVDTVDGVMKFFYCSDASCSTYAGGTTISNKFPADTSTVLGSDGFPLFSYDDLTGSDFYIAKCANATCSASTTETAIDTTGNVGRYSSIIVPSDNLPFASYYDATNGNLKVVKCGNTSCSSGNTITTVDSTGDVGKFTSMALGSDDRPVISYFDATNNDLKVLHCGNAACTSGNAITSVDITGTVGNLSTSIAIGSDSLPIVSYYDTTNGDLKVLHCGQADCSGGGLTGGVNLRLSWGSGSDTETATKMLQYRLKVGTSTAGNDIVSGAAASPNWTSRVMPNGQSRTYILKSLPCSDTYYWNVASLDTGFKATWGTERTFTLDASCAVSNGGGTTGGGGTPTPDTGGGLPARFFNRGTPPPDSIPALGTITLTAFKDANADGKRQPSEELSFRGLHFTASGSTTEGIPHVESAVINTSGVLSFTLPPSDPRGYSILVDTGSSVLEGFTPVFPAVLTGVLLKPDETVTLSLGFKRTDLLRYDPCIRIGSTRTKGSTDAETFLLQLEDAFGETIVPTFSGSLVQRGAFFSALQRTQCIPLIADPEKLKAVARANKTSFIDLLPGASPDSSLAYTLLEEKISVGRRTKIGPAADFSSPLTRREALQAIFDALHPSVIVSTGSTLPLDLSPDDSLVPIFLTLRDLGVLPESYLSFLGPSLGLTPRETSILVARAAFRGGTVPLETPAYDTSALKPSAPPEPNPTFLSLLPTLPVPSCLELHPERPKDVAFTDILPGDPLERDLRTLLAYGSPSADKDRTVWLLSGTLRPTEYGITRGQTRLQPGDPVSTLETLRTLLVYSCMPFSSERKNIQGSGETNVPRDRLADLPRDDSFASRVFYGAQDHQQTFDLSLLTYAPELLRLPSRTPADPLNIEEASALLASALLRLTVDRGLLTPQDAENLSSDLSNAIATQLLHTDIDWRDEQLLRSTPFTREMLVTFLSTVVDGRTLDLAPDTTTARSLGEIWWERVR